jgi:O-antigen/teichoic acid export membrane protein
MVVVGLAGQLSEAGITNAIIAKQTTDRDVLSSLYWANVLIGAGFSLALIATIPAAVAFFDESELAGLIALAAPALVIAPFGQLYGAILAKELSFKPLARIEVTSSLAGAAAAIAAAALGVGAAAIICGFLARSATRAIWLAIRGWRVAPPRRHLRRRDLRGYLSFGAYQMGERTANYLGSNLDYALIGAFLGQAPLGIYNLAFRLITIPQLRLNPILTRVAYPVFAKRRDDDAAVRRGFLELTTMVALVAFPVMAGLAVTAPRLIPVVFGQQWEESVPILQILAALGALFALGNLNGSVFLAKDRPDLGLKLNLLRMVLIAAVFSVTIDYGLQAVAWSFLGVALVMALVLGVVMGRVIGLTLSEYGSALSTPILLSAGMVAAVLAATPVLAELFAGDGAVLVAQVAVGVLAYTVLGWIFARAEAGAVIRMIALGRQPAKES